MVVRAVHVPDTAAAVATLAAGGGRIMAGGTVVMPLVNTGAAGDIELVSLRKAGLAGIEVADGAARIGAAPTPTSPTTCSRH